MIYRIDGSPPGQTGKLDNGRSTATSNQSTAATGSVDSVKANTTDAPLMTQTKTAINGSDGIDRQKVEAIKTAIRNGEFAIDARRVAAAFVDLEMMTGV